MTRADYARTAGLTFTSGSLLALALLCAQARWWAPTAAFGIACIVVGDGALYVVETAAQRRANAIYASRRAHPSGAIDGIVAVTLAEACCEPWWTSCGFHHARTCPRWREPAR